MYIFYIYNEYIEPYFLSHLFYDFHQSTPQAHDQGCEYITYNLLWLWLRTADRDHEKPYIIVSHGPLITCAKRL